MHILQFLCEKKGYIAKYCMFRAAESAAAAMAACTKVQVPDQKHLNVLVFSFGRDAHNKFELPFQVY